MAHCILYQNLERTVTLLDIPRSIELAQGEPHEQDVRRITSCAALGKPFPSVEPKSKKAVANQIQPSIQDLILQRRLQFVLAEVRSSISDEWCLPRVVQSDISKKRRQIDEESIYSDSGDVHEAEEQERRTDQSQLWSKFRVKPGLKIQPTSSCFFQNPTSETTCADIRPYAKAYIPPMSTAVLGDIDTTFSTVMSHAPPFDLVILDPPWPNRSARRKNSYSTSYGTQDIAALLSSIQLGNCLNEGALGGVWITNKQVFRDLVLSPGGLFDQWNLELVEEWIWLKITSGGETICSLDSTWRKPYEILLVGRKISVAKSSSSIVRRVMIAVPDLHSRKPNLKALFEPMLPSPYQALEIFARNLTAGWWAWGNEVLKFQHEDQWIHRVADKK